MSKNLKALAGVIIVGFLVIVLGMAALAAADRPAGGVSFPSGGLTRATEAAESAKLNATAVAPADVYGFEFQAAMPVCPRSTPEDVQKALGLPTAPEGLPSVVEQDTNYLLLIRQDGSSVADEISRDLIDLCGGPGIQPLPTNSLLPLVKDEQGKWNLVA